MRLLRSKLGYPYVVVIGMSLCPLCCTNLVYSFIPRLSSAPTHLRLVRWWPSGLDIRWKLRLCWRLSPVQRVSGHSHYHLFALVLIRTCLEAPFVRPPLMDAASELRACLVDYHALKWAWFALVLKLLLSGLPWGMQPASFVRILWLSIPVKSGAYCAFDLCLMCMCVLIYVLFTL